jgi:hypothetical protein
VYLINYINVIELFILLMLTILFSVEDAEEDNYAGFSDFFNILISYISD